MNAASPVPWREAPLRRKKDTDFRDRSYVEGFPPKVIWLDVGNAGTEAVAQLLTAEQDRAKQFETDKETSMLILSLSKDAV